MPEVRIDLVEGIAEGQRMPTNALSSQEFIAVCSLIVARKPIFEAIKDADQLMRELTLDPLDERFFSMVIETAQWMEREGLRMPASALLKLGKALAEMGQAPAWRERIGKEIDRKLAESIRSEPYLPQRG